LLCGGIGVPENKIVEMADRYDRIYSVHWERFYRFAHDHYVHKFDQSLLDDYNLPADVKEVVLAWGGKNARCYLKEKAPNMGGVTLEELTKTALGIKALKSFLIEMNCQ